MAGSTPASTPRTTARNSRKDNSRKEPGRQVPFGLSIPEGVKINKEIYIETRPLHLSRR